MVTSRDVARHAGVSQATVSRVLNGQPGASAAVRERVMASMEATGFVVNAQAKAMRTSRSGTIGLVTSDIRNPYFPLLLDELARAANSHGVKTIVWDDTTANAAEALDGLASGAVDGLVLTSVLTTSDYVDELIRRDAPFVLCNRAPGRVRADVVMADHEDMARTATAYLVNAGRTKFAAIFGARASVATSFRRRGLFDTLDHAGLRVDDALIHDGLTAYETGREGAERFLESGLDFDTLFCGSDVIAYGAIDGLRSHGVRVPDDVWVSGIDGLPMSAWGAFDLTTIQQDVPEIARRTVNRLVARIAGEATEPVRELVPTDLVVRGSTAHYAG